MNDPKAASVRQRLLNRAHANAEDFNQLLARYVGLRFLCRVAASQYAETFLLKGATLFLVWNGSAHRPTRDIDLLGFTSPDVVNLKAIVKEICATEIENDGLSFDPGSISVSLIRQDHLYGGVRCIVQAALGTAKQKLQIDIGFGDSIFPAPEMIEIPRLLEDELPTTIRAYRVETSVAEKFEAMVSLGMANSRMKDFFDIDCVARTMKPDIDALGEAIRQTFDRRGTPLPENMPIGLTPRFWQDTSVLRRWSSFLSKNGLQITPLETVCGNIASLLEPALNIARHGGDGGAN